MRKIDMHWQSNVEWWEVKGNIPVLKEDAPQEARESYEHYLEQATEVCASYINHDWQEEFAYHILARGKKYFEEGNVCSIQRCGNTYMAAVKGTEDYTVEIDVVDGEIEYMECDCPYAKNAEENCKHMAAVLFALECGDVSIEELPPAKQPPIVPRIPMEIPWLEAIDNLPEDVVRKELLKRADRDERLRERLAVLYIGKLPEGQLQNWKADLQKTAGEYTDRKGIIRADDVGDFLNDLGSFLATKLPLLCEVKAVMDAFHLTWIVMETALEWELDDEYDEMGYLFADCEDALKAIFSMATQTQKGQMLQCYQEHRNENWPGNVEYMDYIFKTVTQSQVPATEKRIVKYFDNIPCFLCEGEWVSFPKNGYLYYDFVEETTAYKDAIPIIEEIIKENLGELYDQFGSCHVIWQQTKQLLLEKYGIEWFSPTELNRGVCFD